MTTSFFWKPMIVFVHSFYMRDLCYTITNKIRFNLKEIEKIKSSFLEAVFCSKWTQFDRISF